MRESTKALKNEMKKDIWMIAGFNNYKFDKRSQQSRKDKVRYYKEKWEHKLRHSDTQAQKSYCINVLMRLQNIK